MKVWVEKLQNASVTDLYLHTIGDAFKELECDVRYTGSVTTVGNRLSDIYVVGIAPSVVKLHAKGAKNIVFWSQGLWPEESRLRNRDRLRLRFTMCSIIEMLALKQCSKLFVVSYEMLRYYTKKYRYSYSDKTMIMACSNETIHSDSFLASNKYKAPSFVYAGSLAGYQCIDRTLELFLELRRTFPEATLTFLTPEVKEANRILEEHGILDTKASYVDISELPSVLSGIKYGFVIRDDIPINRVATPTKLSTYISNGVIPVYSSCLASFTLAAQTTRFKIEVDSSGKWIDDIKILESECIETEEIYKEYTDLFDYEFNCTNKIPIIKEFLIDLVQSKC